MGKITRGFGQPWAELPVGLGNHGQNYPWVWATMGRITRGFGQPWAKIGWVWETMGKNHLWVWAIMGKIAHGFGLPCAKFTRVAGDEVARALDEHEHSTSTASAP